MIAGLRFKPRSAAQLGGNPPPADASALPADLLLALETATVVLRASGPDEGPRAVVQIGDGIGFMAGDARAALLRRWPLSEAQLQRAVRMVGNLVRRASREVNQRREAWVRNW